MSILKLLLIANDIKSIQTNRLELVESLLRHDCDVVISVPYQDSLDWDFNKYPVTIVDNPITRFGINIFSELSCMRCLRKTVRTINPDYILTFTIKPNIYTCIVAGTRYPVLVNITGLSSFILRQSILPVIIAKIHDYTLKKAKCVFCQNDEIYRYFAAKAFTNIKRLPGSGVNLDKVAYRKYPPANDKIYAVTISRIQSDKGINELIEAAEKLSNYVITVIGASEDNSITEKLKTSSSINYIGEVSHNVVLNYLENAHVLIHPSYHEGLANVILEAEAIGRPVLTTDVPGCADAIVPNETGFVFEVRSAEALISACKKFTLISHLERQRMGIVARRFVEKKFDRKIVIEQYLKQVGL